MSRRIDGACMCGAVTVSAQVDDVPRLVACHCEMCRKHNTGMLLSIMSQDAEITGPVKVFDSSDWAQRAFCDTCGSTLWYGTRGGAPNLSAGLFAETGGQVVSEYFCDEALAPLKVEVQGERLTRAETFARFAPEAPVA